MKLKYFVPLLIVFISSLTMELRGQDVEFSQFNAAPLHLNPAMIGFSEEPRLVLNYRHQYPSFSNAFLTLGVSYDQHFEKANSSIGFALLADRTGGGLTGLYNNYVGSFAYAYQLQFSDQLMLKMGAQVSYLQQSINWNDLVFPDALNPVTGQPTQGSNQPLTDNTVLHRADFSLGMMAYTPSFYLGASFKHITRPDMDFYNDNADNENRLQVRSSVHVGKVFYLGQTSVHGRSRFYINPNLLFVNQGAYNQINGGVLFGKGAIFAGVSVRHTMTNLDALIASLGVRSGAFRVGYSYDFNLSGLGAVAATHEISLTLDFGKTRYAEDQKRRANAMDCPETFK